MSVIDEDYREVCFTGYCKTCKYEKVPEVEMPCNECLDNPVNLYTSKPVNWKPRKGFENYIFSE